MTTIDIGGCLPPVWPRPPRPPVPEPEPDSLDAQVDWMTYSHPQLYDMVHSGIDLTGAMAVSAKWARLGDELADIGEELSRLLFTTAQAWEGETAELAKESVTALADWSSETGTLATEVSGCITIQVDNVATARNAMPKPPYPYLPPCPVPTPKPMPMPVVPSQASAFTSGEFGTAAPMVADSMVFTSQERALHQQAAETMTTFQTNSRDVYATVPQFAPPDLRKMPREVPQPPPPPQQPPTPNPQPPVPGPGRPYVGGPGGGSGAGSTPGPGRTAGPGTPLGPGSGSGAAPNEQTGTRPAAAAAAARGGAPAQGGPMGGMPMGGAGGGSGSDDAERKGKYLQKDDDLWGMDEQRVMPPVIGEVNRRA